MKFKTVSLFCGLYFIINSLCAQNYEVYDSLTQNRTIYTKINDSVYSAKTYFKNRLMASGKIIHPNLNMHFDCPNTLGYGSKLNILENRLFDTCRTYEYSGAQINQYIFKDTSILEHSHYENNQIKRFYQLNGNTITLILYDDKGEVYYKAIKTEKKEIHYFHRIGKDVYDIIHTYDSIKNEYVNNALIEHNVILSRDQHYLMETKTYSETGHLLIKSVEYDYFKNRRRTSIYKYNDDNLIIKQVKYHKINLNKKFVTKFKYDQNKNLVFKEYKVLSKKRLKPHKHEIWKKNFKLETIEIKDSRKEIILYLNDKYPYFTKKTFDKKHPYNFIKYQLYDSLFNMSFYDDNQLLFVTTTKSPKFSFDLKFENTDYKTSFSILSQWEDASIFTSQKTDSFFNKDGELTAVHIKSKDTLRRYRYINNKPVLSYHSKYFHISKNMDLCLLGLKKYNNEWLTFENSNTPSYFETIEVYENDTNLLYFCENQNFYTVFDWKGEPIITQVEGLDDPNIPSYNKINRIYIPISDSLRRYWELEKPLIFLVSNSNYNNKLIAEKGKTILAFPGKFISFNNFEYCNLKTIIGAVKTDKNKWQLIDLQGNLSKQSYDTIIHNDDATLVQLDQQNYFLDKNYNLIPRTVHNQIPFNNIGLYWLKDEKMGLKIFDSETLKVIKRIEYDFDSEYNDNYNLVTNNQNKLGLYNHFMREFIPVKYDKITRSQSYYLAINNENIDIYTPFDGFVKKFQCQELHQLDAYRDESIEFSGHNLIFKRNNLYGLLDFGFNVVVDAQYKKALISNYNVIFIDSLGHPMIYNFNSKEFTKFDSTFCYFHSVIGDKNTSGYIDKNGNIEYGIDFIHLNPDRNKLTYITRKHQPIGLLNCLGEKVKDFKDYKKIDNLNKYKYVTDNNNHIGIWDENANEVIKPEYEYICYNSDVNALWFIEHFNPNYKKFVSVWKLKDLKRNVVFSDSFFYPLNFIDNKYCIFLNNHKKFGIIVKTENGLEKVVDAQYTDYYTIDPNHIGLINEKSETLIFNINNNQYLNRPYQYIKELNSKEYLAYNNNQIFLLDSLFQFKSVSNHFFCDKDISLKVDFKINEVFGNDVTDRDNSTRKDSYFMVKNFLYCFYYFNAINLSSYRFEEIYPPIELIPYFENKQSKANKIKAKLDDNFSKPLKLKSDSEYKAQSFYFNIPQEYGPTRLNTFSKNTLSFSVFSENWIKVFFLNFYIDSQNVYEFGLYDLLSKTGINSFNKIIHQEVIKLDSKNLNCFISQDYCDIFNNFFSIHDSKMRLYFGHNYIDYIEIPISKLEPYFKTFWRKKFKNQ